MSNHLHILHLERRVDRYEHLLKQLSEQKIYFYSIHEAIDDKKNTKKAIAYGHKQIVKFAKNNNQPHCIIAEDDVTFTAKGAWQYFLSQIPEDYDLFCGVYYAATVNDEGRILNGMSGTHTLYVVNSRFYEFFLSQPDDAHVDRNLGGYAFKYKYLLCQPMVVTQSGGFSDNLKQVMYYDEYLRDKVLFT